MGSYYCRGTRSTRWMPSSVKASIKRMAVRFLRRRLCVEAMLASIAGRVQVSEIPVPAKPEWKPFVMEGEVPELPLAPHLQAAADEEDPACAEVMFFLAEEAPVVNARRDEESYWQGVVDVDEQLWQTDLLLTPGTLYAPSRQRGRKEPEEQKFDWGLPSVAQEKARERKAQECAAREREYRERVERRHRARYGY